MKMLLQYHRWALQGLVTNLENLSEVERRKDLGLFFKSIHGTLNHLCLVDRLWYGRVIQKPISINSLADVLFHDYHELKLALLENSELWIQYIENLSVDEHQKNILYRDMQGNQHHLSLEMIVYHVVNHGTHHRGQISAAITQLQYPSPELDFLYYALQRS